MSAFGFGLFVGGLVVGAGIIPRALEKSDGVSGIIFLGGILGWVFIPPWVPEFPGFFLGAALPPLLSFAILYRHIRALDEKRRLHMDQREAERRAHENRRAAAEAAARGWPETQVGSTHISHGRLMHIKGQPKCFFMLSDGGGALRIVEYKDDPDFQLSDEVIVQVRTVISLNVASPTVTKSRKKTVPVTTIEKKNKSPVARGLVGGALLGPAGVVLGAASGLNSKVTSSVKHEEVYEDYDTLGDPQLIIGTSDPCQPVLKIKFAPSSLADEWMFRIQGAQRR